MYTCGSDPFFVRILVCGNLRTLLKPVKAVRGTPPNQESKPTPKAKAKAKAVSKKKASEGDHDTEKPRKRRKKADK